jgi:UrcA family protein
MRKLLIAAATLGCLAQAAPALAGGNTWRVGNDSFNVKLNDLDLQTAGGRSAALTRIERAANRLCLRHKLQVDRDACRTDAVAQAAQGAAAPMLHQAMAERAQGAWDVARTK